MNISFNISSQAVISRSVSLDYKQMSNKISAFERLFISKGIQKSQYTGVLLGNSAELLSTVFALWKMNSIPVLINTRLTFKEIDELLKKSSAPKVISSSKYAEKLSPGHKAIMMDEENPGVEESGALEIAPGSVVIFTSGTSGHPKGVLLKGEALAASINAGNSVLNQTGSDRWLASLPFYHIGGFMIFLRAFKFGASVILPESLRLEDIKESIYRDKPTLISLVPTQLLRLLDESAGPNAELRILLLGGGTIEQSLVSRALEKGWPVSTVYGATETASFVAYMSPDELRRNPGSSGRAVHPNEIEIQDSGVIEGDPAGEIVVTSSSLFSEYINDPEETHAKLKDGRYYTGDYGILDQNNNLYVLSRRTDMIVTGGENVDPAEVETAIRHFPGITDVCVFGRSSKEWGEVVNAAVCTEGNLDLEALDDFLKQDLARYKIPKEYFFVSDIPRTALGKIRREKVKAMFNQS